MTFPSWEHGERIKWLMKNAGLSGPPETVAVDETGEFITIETLIDEVVYQKYLKTFEPDQFYSKKTDRSKAPEGWS